jgi:hypothetical protein
VVVVADVLESVARTRSASWTRRAPTVVNCDSALQWWQTEAASRGWGRRASREARRPRRSHGQRETRRWRRGREKEEERRLRP